VAIAQFSSGGVAIRYVLPVLWMMSRLPVTSSMDQASKRVSSNVFLRWQHGFYTPAYGQSVREVYQESTQTGQLRTGAEPDVYECLVFSLVGPSDHLIYL